MLTICALVSVIKNRYDEIEFLLAQASSASMRTASPKRAASTSRGMTVLHAQRAAIAEVNKPDHSRARSRGGRRADSAVAPPARKDYRSPGPFSFVPGLNISSDPRTQTNSAAPSLHPIVGRPPPIAESFSAPPAADLSLASLTYSESNYLDRIHHESSDGVGSDKDEDANRDALAPASDVPAASPAPTFAPTIAAAATAATTSSAVGPVRPPKPVPTNRPHSSARAAIGSVLTSAAPWDSSTVAKRSTTMPATGSIAAQQSAVVSKPTTGLRVGGLYDPSFVPRHPPPPPPTSSSVAIPKRQAHTPLPPSVSVALTPKAPEILPPDNVATPASALRTLENEGSDGLASERRTSDTHARVALTEYPPLREAPPSSEHWVDSQSEWVADSRPPGAVIAGEAGVSALHAQHRHHQQATGLPPRDVKLKQWVEGLGILADLDERRRLGLAAASEPRSSHPGAREDTCGDDLCVALADGVLLSEIVASAEARAASRIATLRVRVTPPDTTAVRSVSRSAHWGAAAASSTISIVVLPGTVLPRHGHAVTLAAAAKNLDLALGVLRSRPRVNPRFLWSAPELMSASHPDVALGLLDDLMRAYGGGAGPRATLHAPPSAVGSAGGGPPPHPYGQDVSERGHSSSNRFDDTSPSPEQPAHAPADVAPMPSSAAPPLAHPLSDAQLMRTQLARLSESAGGLPAKPFPSDAPPTTFALASHQLGIPKAASTPSDPLKVTESPFPLPPHERLKNDRLVVGTPVAAATTPAAPTAVAAAPPAVDAPTTVAALPQAAKPRVPTLAPIPHPLSIPAELLDLYPRCSALYKLRAGLGAVAAVAAAGAHAHGAAFAPPADPDAREDQASAYAVGRIHAVSAQQQQDVREWLRSLGLADLLAGHSPSTSSVLDDALLNGSLLAELVRHLEPDAPPFGGAARRIPFRRPRAFAEARANLDAALGVLRAAPVANGEAAGGIAVPPVPAVYLWACEEILMGSTDAAWGVLWHAMRSYTGHRAAAAAAANADAQVARGSDRLAAGLKAADPPSSGLDVVDPAATFLLALGVGGRGGMALRSPASSVQEDQGGSRAESVGIESAAAIVAPAARVVAAKEAEVMSWLTALGLIALPSADAGMRMTVAGTVRTTQGEAYLPSLESMLPLACDGALLVAVATVLQQRPVIGITLPARTPAVTLANIRKALDALRGVRHMSGRFLNAPQAAEHVAAGKPSVVLGILYDALRCYRGDPPDSRLPGRAPPQLPPSQHEGSAAAAGVAETSAAPAPPSSAAPENTSAGDFATSEALPVSSMAHREPLLAGQGQHSSAGPAVCKERLEAEAVAQQLETSNAVDEHVLALHAWGDTGAGGVDGAGRHDQADMLALGGMHGQPGGGRGGAAQAAVSVAYPPAPEAETLARTYASAGGGRQQGWALPGDTRSPQRLPHMPRATKDVSEFRRDAAASSSDPIAALLQGQPVASAAAEGMPSHLVTAHVVREHWPAADPALRASVGSVVRWLARLGVHPGAPDDLLAPAGVPGGAPEWEDGVLLARVVEAVEMQRGLRRSEIPGIDRAPRTAAARLANVRRVLDILRAHPHMPLDFLWSEGALRSGDAGVIRGLLAHIRHAYR